MTLVIDASAVVAALVDDGTDGTWAESLLTSDSLAAPHMLHAEASNILRRSALAGAISAEEASLAHADLLDLRVELFPYASFAERILGSPPERNLLRRLVRGSRGSPQRAARNP